MIKLDNPFTPQPEPIVTFWAAKSGSMVKFRDFFENQCVTRGAWPSHSVVGDVGSGKTRLMKYLMEKFKLDTTKIVCYVSLQEVFRKMGEKPAKEMEVNYVQTFNNEIYLQLEKIYESVLTSESANSTQREFAERIINLIKETKRKIIGPRFKELATHDAWIKEIDEKLKKVGKDETLEERKRVLESATSRILREEVFTQDEFYSFLRVFLDRLRKELNVDVFILYVDEMEKIIEMERYGIFLKSITQTELRERLVQEFTPQGLKVIVACTSKIWVNFTEMFRQAFRPQPIPNLEFEDLNDAIKEHLKRLNQEKYNPFKDLDAIKFIAHYSYHNFRNCMAVLNFCYEDYRKKLELGEKDWTCDLEYVMKNHFDKSIKVDFYNYCVQMLEKELPKRKKPQLERWVKSILVRFEEFDYDTLWKNFKLEAEKYEFDLFVNTLRTIGAIEEITKDVYIVNRENFATLEFERTYLERRFLDIFYELAGTGTEADLVAFRKRLEEEKFDDRTIDSVMRSLGDTLQIFGDKVRLTVPRPEVVDRIKEIVRSVGREPRTVKLEMVNKRLAPYIITEVWEWEAKKYTEDNMWVVSTSFDPTTGGAIERKIAGILLFRDYRHFRPPEDILKADALRLKRALQKNKKLQFGLILCIYEPPLPDFLGLKATESEVTKAKDDPMLWKKLFSIHGQVLGSENTIATAGFDIIWEEDKIKFSDLLFVYPIHGDERFPAEGKFEGEKIIDYILALEKMPSLFGKEFDSIKANHLDLSLKLLKNILVNPILVDPLLKSILNRMWEIDLPIGMLRDEKSWPQTFEKKKWVDNTEILNLLDQIATNVTVKCNDENRKIAAGLITSGFFGYHGKQIDEIYLKQDISVSGKMVPKQFKEIFGMIGDDPNDAENIFQLYLENCETFKGETPEEMLLSFNVQKFAARKTRGLVESVDLALHLIFKMFPDSIVLVRRTEDNRFTYKLLKEIVDPKSFLKNIETVDKTIAFLIDKGFKLDLESGELKELLKIAQIVERKMDKALAPEAKQIMMEEKESVLTKQKLTAHARCDALSTAIMETLGMVKEALCAYPSLSEWLKNPYGEEWNEQTLAKEKEALLPLPDKIKYNLEKTIGAWFESEGCTKEEREKIMKLWEMNIWSKIEGILSDEAKKVSKWMEAVKGQMSEVPNISSAAEQLAKLTSLSFEDHIKFLKPIKNLEKVTKALNIARGYVEGGEGIVDYVKKAIVSYNYAVADVCLKKLDIIKEEIEKLDEIFSETSKIDVCKKKTEEYQNLLTRARTKFYDEYREMMGRRDAGILDKREIKKKSDNILGNLTINQFYGCLILYVVDREAKNEIQKVLYDSLVKTKFVEYQKSITGLKKFCDEYNVVFKEGFWTEKEEQFSKKYELLAESYVDGIWQQLETKVPGTEIKDMTAFMQHVTKFNEENVKSIITSIPKGLQEPYSTILKEIKEAYERKEIFETVLALISSEKVRRKLKPEEVLKFLKEVEKFGLLW